MRPKKNISSKVISSIMMDFLYKTDTREQTKRRLKKHSKHLKYLWKLHFDSENAETEPRNITYVDDDDIVYICDRWQCSYRIQMLMVYSDVWKK